jgi:hypothetical protein
MPILVPTYDNDGNRNGILLSDTLDQDYFDDLVNETDASKRWYPLPNNMKNVDDVRADIEKETFDDGATAFIREGIRTFKGWMINAPAKLKGKIESVRCVEVGVYLVDKNGNLIGTLSEDGLTLYPIQIDKDSMSARFIKATDKTVQKIELMFNYSVEEKDENLAMITCTELGDVELLQLTGLLNISSEYSAIDNTTFTVVLNTEYGTPLNPVTDKGLVAADFALYNLTTSANITITSVTESTTSPGTYVFVFPSQTNADVLRLTPTKDGRDYTDVVANHITMPLT